VSVITTRIHTKFPVQGYGTWRIGPNRQWTLLMLLVVVFVISKVDETGCVEVKTEKLDEYIEKRYKGKKIVHL
jgi:hypothetical protein